MPADPTTPPTPDSLPDILPKPAPLGTPVPASVPPRRLRHKRPWLTRVLTGRRYDDEVIVYRHSHLFYWWPVWLLGFVFALVSWIGDRHMAIVPAHTEAAERRKVEVTPGGPLAERDVLILPAGKHLPTRKDAEGNVDVAQPTIYIAPHPTIGTIYLFVLLAVVVLTNISLRGLWSFLLLMTIALVIVILYLANAWGAIFRNVGQLSIYINMGGYFLISAVLLALWALNFFVLDRMTYMIFTPGQVRVRLEIGGGEMCYDATGMTVQKQRADLFRHWGLGLGSGDLIVWPLNASHAVELPNVLRVGRVVREIEQLVKEKVVVSPDAKQP
jgi:hypothetical protein